MSEKRRPIPRDQQVDVFRRDKWLCSWCRKPVVFPPVMRYLEAFVRTHGQTGPLAYFKNAWTRHDAPLLDSLGAVIDHKEPHARGGGTDMDNLVTSCNKCNGQKNSKKVETWKEQAPRRPGKGKDGDPVHWDGFSSLFVILLRQFQGMAKPVEADWYQALTGESLRLPK